MNDRDVNAVAPTGPMPARPETFLTSAPPSGSALALLFTGLTCTSLLFAAACGSNSTPPESGSSGAKGPPGGKVDVDLSKIPAVPLKPGTGTGGAGGTSGAAGSAGSVASGGSSATAKKCTGTATACASRGAATCATGQGCSSSEQCAGSSIACYLLSGNQYSCMDQAGCYWDSIAKSCSGSSTSCSSILGQLSCVSQSGCSWTVVCKGVETPCSLVPLTDCSLQPGCTVTGG